MTRPVKAVVAIIVMVGVVVLLYAVLTPQRTYDTSDHMGMYMGQTSYSSLNVGLIVVSIAMIVVALMIALLWQEYEPLPPSFAPPSAYEPMNVPREGVSVAQVPGPDLPPAPPPQEPDPDEEKAREYLVLRLLTGDERIMFKAIMDSGGEALQKDLILSTKMSNAKVSRLLDRLMQKGVVTKERYGATNKVRVRFE